MLRFCRFFCGILLLLSVVPATAQTPAPAGGGLRQPRILVLMDGSSSMLQPWNAAGDIRFRVGGRIVEALMDSIYAINPQVEFGLRVYGNQSPAQERNCFDSRREVGFSKDNRTQMALRMASIQPLGVSPIAWSLKESAENDLVNEQQNAYSIILVTDGGESCNGNICEVVRQLLDRKIFFKPYVLSLVDDAPLQKVYDCLGNFLVVAKEPDIQDAIRKLTDAYRPILTMPTIISRADQKPSPIPVKQVPPVAVIPEPPVVKPAPPVVVPDPPVSRPEPVRVREGITLILLPRRRRLMTPSWNPNRRIAGVRRTAPGIALPKADPPIASAIIIDTAVAIRVDRPALPTPQRIPLPQAQPAPALKKETISFIPRIARRKPGRAPVWRSGLRLAGAPRTAPRIAPPSYVPRKIDTVARVVTPPVTTPPPVKPTPPPVKPTPPPPTRPVETRVATTAEPAEKTSLRIYFTDGHGKYYYTSPQIILTDLKTGEVRKFYRTIDGANEPDAKELPPGKYSMSIVGKAGLKLEDVTIFPDQLNRAVIEVQAGTLRFAYQGNPDRPVSEFEAIVNRRFEPGPTIRQRLTAQLPYDPGNYYVEANTLPVTRWNTDIDFGTETLLTIREPGWVQFMNTNNVGKVNLFYQSGDQYLRFHTMDVPGVPQSQKLRLKPGPYEVRFVVNPGTPAAKEKAVRFLVESNKTYTMTLE